VSKFYEEVLVGHFFEEDGKREYRFVKSNILNF